jgi:hypothetical protein
MIPSTATNRPVSVEVSEHLRAFGAFADAVELIDEHGVDV